MNLLGRTGGSLTSHPSVFTACSKFLLVPVGASIKVVEVESGAIVRLICPIGRSEVTQIILNPLKPENQIISCTVDGSITFWDWTTGESIRVFRTGHAMHSMTLKSFDLESKSLELFVVSMRLKGPLGCNFPDSRKLFNYCGQKLISLIDHVKLNVTDGTFSIRQIFKARGLSRLAINSKGDELVFNSREEVRFVRLDGGKASEEELKVYKTLKHTSAITRIQYHPREPCLVLADRHGQIVMWYCLDGSAESSSVTSYAQRTLHWHANEVTDMAFTSGGQYLLSGGEESVMVLWQIETSLRQYLPRLGDPIHFICVSPDDKTVAVSTSDNSIHLVSLTSGSSLSVFKSVRGCKPIPSSSSSVICKTSQSSSTLLIPGNPGTLQVYDPVRDSVQDILEIAPQNRPTGFKAQNRKVLEVARCAVSSCGKWMVTLEQRNSRKPLKTILTARLKFWGKQGESDNSWTLLSIVERPHKGIVTDLCTFTDANGIPFAVSTSLDGTFKIWKIDMENGIWICSHVGSYHDIPAGSVGVNFERTRLAIVYGASVTVWSIQDGIRLVDVLIGTQSAEFKEARFLADGSIVAWCPENGTFVFNPIGGESRLSISWHCPVSPKTFISVHPEKAHFAMIVDAPSGEHQGVMTFESESPVPIGYYMLPEKLADFKAAVYVPSPESVRKVRPGQAESHILVLYDGLTGEFTLLGSENASRLNRSDFKLRIKPEQIRKPEESVDASNERSKSLYHAIFESADGLTLNPILDAKVETVKHSMAELFAAVPQISLQDILLPTVASHVLPPVPMLFSNYIQKIIKKRN